MKKCGLRKAYQAGGVPRKETTDELLARMRATYGGAPSSPAEPAPAPAPVQAAPQPVAAKPQGFLGGIRSALDPERRMKQQGFENGGRPGIDEGGYIRGPKGVDKVPAKIAETGEDILVTAGERIVNKEQNAELEKLAAEKGMGLDEYLEATTGKPVGPKLKQGLRAAQSGWPVPYDPRVGQQGRVYTDVRDPSYSPQRSTVPVQDGVRTGSPNPAPRPNWIDPTRQVATIDSTARRVPNGPGTALVPTNGQTQFHDKITAEEMARGNQNRAAGFRAAAEAAEARPPQQGAPAAPTPQAPESKLQAAKRIGGKTVGGLNAAAAVGTGVYDMATANEPAEQVVGALKASGAAPGLAGLPGKLALYGDMAVQGLTGKSVAQLADKAVQWHPDYMMDKNREWGTGGTRAEVQPTPTKPVPARPTTPATSDPSYDRKEFRGAAGNIAARQELDNADIKGLRAAGVTGAVMGDVTEKGKTPNQGIRTIDTANGKVYAGRDKSGQLHVNFNSGLSASDADKQRDEQFAKAGYGKDTYGNWMTPQRAADKQALARIQRERAEFNAFSDQVTDPNARAAGLRAMMMKYGPADKAAADAAKLQAEQALAIRGQDITLRGQDNMQRNSERDFNQKQSEAHYKRLDDIIKAKATVDGEFDGQKYAMLQQYAGNFKSDAKVGSEAYFKDLMANLGLDEKFMADDGSLFRSVRSQGADPARGLRQQDGVLWGSYYVDPATNRRVSASELSKLSPSEREVFLSRLQAQQ